MQLKHNRYWDMYDRDSSSSKIMKNEKKNNHTDTDSFTHSCIWPAIIQKNTLWITKHMHFKGHKENNRHRKIANRKITNGGDLCCGTDPTAPPTRTRRVFNPFVIHELILLLPVNVYKIRCQMLVASSLVNFGNPKTLFCKKKTKQMQL